MVSVSYTPINNKQHAFQIEDDFFTVDTYLTTHDKIDSLVKQIQAFEKQDFQAFKQALLYQTGRVITYPILCKIAQAIHNKSFEKQKIDAVFEELREIGQTIMELRKQATSHSGEIDSRVELAFAPVKFIRDGQSTMEQAFQSFTRFDRSLDELAKGAQQTLSIFPNCTSAEVYRSIHFPELDKLLQNLGFAPYSILKNYKIAQPIFHETIALYKRLTSIYEKYDQVGHEEQSELDHEVQAIQKDLEEIRNGTKTLKNIDAFEITHEYLFKPLGFSFYDLPKNTRERKEVVKLSEQLLLLFYKRLVSACKNNNCAEKIETIAEELRKINLKEAIVQQRKSVEALEEKEAFVIAAQNDVLNPLPQVDVEILYLNRIHKIHQTITELQKQVDPSIQSRVQSAFTPQKLSIQENYQYLALNEIADRCEKSLNKKDYLQENRDQLFVDMNILLRNLGFAPYSGQISIYDLSSTFDDDTYEDTTTLHGELISIYQGYDIADLPSQVVLNNRIQNIQQNLEEIRNRARVPTEEHLVNTIRYSLLDAFGFSSFYLPDPTTEKFQALLQLYQQLIVTLYEKCVEICKIEDQINPQNASMLHSKIPFIYEEFKKIC